MSKKLQSNFNFKEISGSSFLIHKVLENSGFSMFRNLDAKNVGSSGTLGTSEDAESAYIPFCMLSASVIEGLWIDFSKEGVLRDAVDKFNHVTIYGDHRPSVHNWLGVTQDAYWDQNGTCVNAVFKIDKVKDPMVARGLTIQPPAIKCCSVGIEFESEMSHPGMKFWDFVDRLGKDIDGQKVRFIATKILSVDEVSLVYAGADPNARKLDKLRKVDFMADVELDAVTKIGTDKDDLSTDKNIYAPAATHATVLNAVFEKLGINKDLDFGGKVLALENLALLAKKHIDLGQKEALNLYIAFAGDKIDPNITRLIEFGDFDSVCALKNQYKALLDLEFPKNALGIRRSSVGVGLDEADASGSFDFSRFHI